MEEILPTTGTKNTNKQGIEKMKAKKGTNKSYNIPTIKVPTKAETNNGLGKEHDRKKKDCQQN